MNSLHNLWALSSIPHPVWKGRLRENTKGHNSRRIPPFLFALISIELRLYPADPVDG